ncbi:MAG: T9SS type A sorting domain-containing protein [Bacteroidia bacterium]
MKHNTTQHNSKSYLLILLVAMYVFTTNKSRAQSYANDRVLAAPLYVSPTPAPAPLAYSSNAYLTKYGRYEYHIPDASTPQKTIKLNINVFLDNAGGNNWPNNATTNTKFAQLIADINAIYGANAQPSDLIAGIPFIADTKIRYELANVYYYVNSTLNAQDPNTPNSNVSQDLLDYIYSIDPSRFNALNICLTNYIPSATDPTSIATLPTLGAGADLSIVSFGTWNNGGTVKNYDLAHHWARELGYCLDLKSTYQTSPQCVDCEENCTTTDSDYLSDVFNYTTCLHAGGISCNPLLAGNTCTNNIMGGTYNNAYFSPKQMGKMHRALALKTTQRYVKDCAYNTTPKVITASETWDFGMKMYNDIVVEAPAVVELNHSNVLMPNNAKIIVKPGAKLNVTHYSRITSGCDLMWSGIEVWGNPTQAQNTTTQGYMAISNNSFIENAHVGVRLYKSNAGNTYNGGVLQAGSGGVYFKNNYKGVEFLPYASPSNADNKSYFEHVEFSSDAVLKDPIYIDGGGRRYPSQYGIVLTGVKGIIIKNTRFYYFLPSVGSGLPIVDIDLRGTGIYAQNATFVLPKPLFALTENKFTNLTKGIDATATLATVTNYISIKGAIFTNVQQGIQGTLNFGTIDQNTFNIPNFTGNPAGVKPWGIYLTGSKGFNIAHNTFVGISPFVTNNPNYGVIIKGSNSFGGTIGFNDFNNITIANQMEDNNPALQIKCNTYTNHRRAWSINPGAGQATSTFVNQGTGCLTNQVRANNMFNDACNYGDDHIHSYLNNSFTYFGTGNFTPFPLPLNPLQPNCYVGNITIPNPVCNVSNDQSCYEAPPCTTSACAGAQRIKMNAEAEHITKLQLANEALRMYTALGETTGIIDVLTDLNTEDANKLLIAEYIAANNTTVATTLLNNLDISTADNKAFYDYYTIVLQLAQSKVLSPMQLATLTTLTNSGTEVSNNAQAMLSSINATVINRSPNVDVNAEYKITVVKQLPTTINELKINPNPFNETATVNINLTVSTATLQLRTVLGEVVQKHSVQEGENTIVINKNNLAQGMYVLVLVQENKVIATQKIIINQ